jgi:fibronectin-binding autotransporter adhesin
VDANNNDINGSTFTVGMKAAGTSTFSGAAAGGVAVDLHVRSTGGTDNSWNFEAGSGATVKFAGAIINTGGNVNCPVSKIGPGTVIFSGVNTYAGSTLVANGTLTGVVGGSCANSDVTVAATAGNTATLGVSVTNNTKQWTCANLTVNNAGTKSGLQFDFGAQTPSATVPPLNVAGSVAFTTAPAVAIAGSSLPVSTGDGYPLLAWGSGPAPSLAGVTLTLPPGVEGSLSNVGSALYLQISRGTIPSTPTNITYSVTGSTLTIGWPASYLGWILQSQTNALNVGLKSNWHDVSGSATVYSTNLPIDPANPSVFYRLRHP